MQVVELRWLKDKRTGEQTLQYRSRMDHIAWSQWSDWYKVPTVIKGSKEEKE